MWEQLDLFSFITIETERLARPRGHMETGVVLLRVHHLDIASTTINNAEHRFIATGTKGHHRALITAHLARFICPLAHVCGSLLWTRRVVSCPMDTSFAVKNQMLVSPCACFFCYDFQFLAHTLCFINRLRRKNVPTQQPSLQHKHVRTIETSVPIC